MKTPILLLLFNRPDLTKKLILNLKQVKPVKIYINVDGPRKNNKNDLKLCKEVINKIKKEIDWKSKIYLNINKKNLGCRHSVSKAIDWFFYHEKYGIILEDDCIPKKFFLNFVLRCFLITKILIKLK